VLLWVYYSAQIFLFGAEFTWVYSHRFGSRKGQPLPVTATVFPAPQCVTPSQPKNYPAESNP